MTLIALAKTWDIDPNNRGGQDSVNLADHQRTMFAIKEGLTGAGELTNPMTVVASSDSVTADASDNWGVYTDLVWAAGNHSWIVLQMGAGGAQICLDLNNVNARLITPMWSPADGFTGGVIGARPTATDEQPISLAGGTYGWLGNNTGTGGYTSHIWGATDGESYRVATYKTDGYGSVASWMCFEKLTRPTVATPAYHGYTMCLVGPSSTNGHCMEGDGALTPNDDDHNRTEHNGTPYGVRLGGEAAGTSAAAKTKINAHRTAAQVGWNRLSEKHELFPVSAVGEAGTAIDGRLGEYADIFWASRVSADDIRGRSDGDFYPEADDSDGARQLVQVGAFALPWGLAVAMETLNME